MSSEGFLKIKTGLAQNQIEIKKNFLWDKKYNVLMKGTMDDISNQRKLSVTEEKIIEF